MNNTKKFTRLIYSVVKRQMLWYILASVVLGILICLTTFLPVELGLSVLSMVSSSVGFLIYLSPLVFKCFKTRSLFITLPTSGNVKARTIILYTIIIVPLIILLPAALIEIFATVVFGLSTKVLSAYLTTTMSIGFGTWIFSLSQYVLIPLLALYVVFNSRTSVTGKTIGVVLGFMILSGFIGGVFGAISALSNPQGIELLTAKAQAGAEINPASVFELLPGFITFLKVCGIVQALLAATLLVIVYRKIVNLQA